jgi:hypothetical protein
MADSKFCGMTQEWQYDKGHVSISMPGYIEKALQRFTHLPPSRPQHSPMPVQRPTTAPVSKTQSSLTPPSRTMHRASTAYNSTILFYDRAIDSTMLVAQSTLAAAIQLLSSATHPDAAARFYKSDMTQYVHSDASYLIETRARSRLGGYFYLGNSTEPADHPRLNGPIHVLSSIINVLASAAEAESEMAKKVPTSDKYSLGGDGHSPTR